jgi:molybdate-binding protein
MAASHLLQDENTDEYNFDVACRELDKQPAVVNFCRREQGLIVAAGNPKNISGIGDLGRRDIRLINRPEGTGTRVLLDRELSAAGLDPGAIDGYEEHASRHLDVAIEILQGRADVGMGIRAVAALLGLDFMPIRWERFDLLISKDRFFEPGIQRFLGFLHEPSFREAAGSLSGYGIDLSGKMLFPGQDG